MRETAAAFRARTGRAYAGATAGRPLGDDEPCPTLFRWPGAGALRDALTTGLPTLGPPGHDTLWLCEDGAAPAPGGAGRFGTLVVLEPLALGAALAAPLGGAAVYAARNQPIGDEGVLWIPARLVAAGGAPWAAVATAADARAVVGPGWDDERARAVDALSAYLEELHELSRAGAPPPPRPWHDLDAAARARVLAGHGVRGRFTLP